jgi:ubiquinone/menaquinone biosynthesis C-methylase UbiE
MSNPIVTNDAKSPTDQDALSTRIASYNKFASKDILQVLERALNTISTDRIQTILDIGCGTGKQSIWLAKRFPNAKILAVDVSDKALSKIMEEQLPNIIPLLSDFNSPGFLNDITAHIQNFDLIISFYAIYYSNDITTLIQQLRSILKPEGKLIFAGYSRFNNRELLEITKELTNDNFETGDFIDPHALSMLLGHDQWNYYYFNNPLVFPNVSTFESYYRNYGLYDSKIETALLNIVQERITSHGNFTLTKSSLIIESSKSSDYESAECLPHNLKSDKFSSVEYRSLLKLIKAKNYTVIKFSDIFINPLNDSNSLLLLRHDVDNTLELALQLAEIEFEEGICSSYYFLLSGGFYNAITEQSRDIIKKIASLGHEIGLHFENPSLFQEDAKFLETILNKPVETFSQHNPTIDGLKQIGNTTLVNAYDKRITQDLKFKYISDSGMKWRKETAFDAIGAKRLYLLLHPEAWCSEGMDLIQQLRTLERVEINKIKRKFNKYISGNIEYLKTREMESNR